MCLFKDKLKQLDESFQYAEINDETRLRLRSSELTIEASLPLRLDDGTLMTFKGYRCRYSTILGPGKGGTRFAPNITKEEIETLAFLMTFKCAIVRLSLGGSKGGIAIDPKTLSHRELERVSKLYIDAFSPFIGEDIDSLGPDLGTDEKIMGFMYARYRDIKGGQPKGVVTGKPIPLGGIQGRKTATGYGGFFILENIIENFNHHFKIPQEKEKLRVAIHGFGNVGSNFAEICHRNGMQVVAISDINGGVYNENGLNITACKKSHEKGDEWEDGDKITNEELFQLDNIDVLVPAAVQDVITKDNASKIKSPIILELANAPTTSEADLILKDKGITVIPDLLANAGGVVVSYLEWLQNKNGISKTLEEVHSFLKQTMNYACNKVMERHSLHKITLRTAAYALALKRIADAIECTGTKDYFRN